MIQVTTLSNGIRLVTEQMASTHSISIGVWVNAGSVMETEQQSGISHFIEHMLFKGTTERDAKAIAVEVDAMGGTINAFTSKESTCYYIKVLDENVENAIDILADIYQNSTLSEDLIEREKGVILEEIAMTYDTPEDLAFESAMGAFFRGSALESEILGTEETVKSFKREDLLSYMEEFYTAENTVIAVAGNFDLQTVTDLLERAFRKVRHGVFHPYPATGAFRESEPVLIQKDSGQVNLCLVFPGCAAGTKEYYALAILSNALGGSMSSRLFQSIREERGLAYSVYSYPAVYRDTGCLSLYAGSGEKQAEEVLRLLLQEATDLIENGITEEEFQRNKQLLKGSFLLGMETASSHMLAIGKNLLLLNRKYDLEATISCIECVTMEDVREMIGHVFGSGHTAFAAVGNIASVRDSLKSIFEEWLDHAGR